LTKPTFDVTVL